MYAYAFTNAPEFALELPAGIAGKVQLLTSDRLAALVEPELSLEAIQNDEEQLLQAVLSHDRVICELFRQITLLPLRFGTYFVSAESLLAHLQVKQDEYFKQLTRFAGKAEYCVRFVPLEPPSDSMPSETRGKQYFLAKKQRYQSQIDFQAQQAEQWHNVREALVRVYPDAIASLAQPKEERIYILGDRHEESSLASYVQAWQQTCSHWQLYLGDPLPPYHFVTDVST